MGAEGEEDVNAFLATVRDWIDDNGYGDPDGVKISVTAHTGGSCRIKLAPTESKCERCTNKGPSLGTRLMGRCNACETIRSDNRINVSLLKLDLILLLRERFDFEGDFALPNRYAPVRDGVHDSGAVVNIFVKEKKA
jgi:hypothetical protein